MGFSRPRPNKHGSNRYTAVYLDGDGIERSAGTFGSEKQANSAWMASEAKVAEGRGRHLIRGRQRFQTYVEQTYLPNNHLELTSLEGYTYSIYAHIMDFFGHMRMKDIYADTIRSWIAHLKAKGLSRHNINKQRTVLSAILSTAVNDEVLLDNPCRRVKTDTIEHQHLTIVTPEDFDTFYNALADDQSKLLVELAIASGLHWGELGELRPRDFDTSKGIITVSRPVVCLTKKIHPDGKRFFVKDYPKDKKSRTFKIDPAVMRRVSDWITQHHLGDDDLIFRHRPRRTVPPQAVEEASTEDLGWTTPNPKNRTYRHGTVSAYNLGRCRCPHCKKAIAIYRASRRAAGKDNLRTTNTAPADNHIPGEHFRERIIKPALKKAKIRTNIRMHLLRHAHASWLLNGGADLQVVKERLGHAKITTTERYLYTLDNADETALEAFNKVRHRSTPSPQDKPHSPTTNRRLENTPKTAEQLLKDLAQIQTALSQVVGLR